VGDSAESLMMKPCSFNSVVELGFQKFQDPLLTYPGAAMNNYNRWNEIATLN
jgi:hypothetical protein